jgi:hypothetical protein
MHDIHSHLCKKLKKINNSNQIALLKQTLIKILKWVLP